MSFIVLAKDSSPSKSLPIEAVSKVFWEPGVLTGYRRPNQPWMYYIKSLFWIHNESGNIWTHLVTLPILFGVIYKLTQLIDFGSNAAVNSLLVFIVTTFTVALLSSAAHLFHSKSIPMHFIMLSVDYLGISIFSYGVSCMLYYCSGNELFYSYFGNIYPVMNWIAGINFTVCCTLGNSLYKGTPHERHFSANLRFNCVCGHTSACDLQSLFLPEGRCLVIKFEIVSCWLTISVFGVKCDFCCTFTRNFMVRKV